MLVYLQKTITVQSFGLPFNPGCPRTPSIPGLPGGPDKPKSQNWKKLLYFRLLKEYIVTTENTITNVSTENAF